MNTPRFGSLLLALAASFALIGIGCGSPSKTEAARAVPAAVSTAPAVQYTFYNPASEQDLRNDTVYGFLIVKTSATFRESLFESQGLKVAGRFTAKGFNYYHLQKDAGLMEAMDDLRKISGILYVEPDVRLTKDSGIVYDNPDPRALSEEYSLALTQCKQAWTTYGFGANRPTTVDIDTGVNFGHEDLTGIVTHAFSWYDLDNGGALIDGSDDPTVQPLDYLGTARTSTDGAGHGTHTAGTLAARGNNGKGVAGVCWNVDLVSYKGLSDAGSGGTWAIYGSLYHLIQWKAAHYPHTIAVNMSLGGSSASQFAIDMVEQCVENNVVIVASMGNTGQSLAQYPAGYAGVVAVGATNGQDKKVHFSTSGRNISVCAPGYDIISTYIGSTTEYESDSGTSMSAPFVTGLVNYMLTFAPDLNPAQIKTYLEANADFIEGATGYTEGTGWGRVNVLKTIAAVVADVNAHTTPASNYVNAPLKVKVLNTFQGSTSPFSGVATYLYQCDSAGAISNYVASSLTVAGSVTGEDGVAFFNLLRPGYYVVKTYYGSTAGSSSVFQVQAGQSIPVQTINYALPLYYIQTFPTAAGGTADDIITLYNAAGATLTTYDVGALDTLAVVLPSATYTIRITTYGGFYGEYALWMGPALHATPAPNTFATVNTGAGEVLGSQSHVKATPQAIGLNTLVYGKTTSGATAGDFYAVVIP
ncbi:S8 family serine peptidase [Geothrix sp. 21YS21S-4]|uniref:S8 family peptidase n=1 Tax=Geothrix sp. 21YS21S-4 TaxID=3068889 RepID=UPI0027B9D40E|nr:S8 family serine peptidase [Geothrix sp. 21YS21S-4]